MITFAPEFIIFKRTISHPMKNVSFFLKGFAMGTANVIPGVSGGTIALITGVFERMINSIKSFNLDAIKQLFRGDIKGFAAQTDLGFLSVLLTGMMVSVFTVAKLLSFLFMNYPIFIWSFFFGLIVASIWLVGKTISNFNMTVVLFLLIGTTIAASITILSPARENDSFFYLILCGVVAVCSMILPGISGSFVLVLMGNYELVLRSITELNITNLAAIGIGCAIGLPAFSHLLSWLYKKYKNQTIALLTGFIAGSLAIIWPWKLSFDSTRSLIPVNEFGALLTLDTKVFSYERILPATDIHLAIAILLAIAGFLTIYLLEKKAEILPKNWT
jgi:putative membrane protein